jgi:hypothetical protein
MNRGDTAVDINGWTIQDNGGDLHVINNGGPLTIDGWGLLVLGNNGNSATNGGAPVDYEYSNFVLDNDADEIVLLDGSLAEIDRVEYYNPCQEDEAPFPPEWGYDCWWRCGEGHPYHFDGLVDDDNNDPANWYHLWNCILVCQQNGYADCGTPGWELDQGWKLDDLRIPFFTVVEQTLTHADGTVYALEIHALTLDPQSTNVALTTTGNPGDSTWTWSVDLIFPDTPGVAVLRATGMDDMQTSNIVALQGIQDIPALDRTGSVALVLLLIAAGVAIIRRLAG